MVFLSFKEQNIIVLRILSPIATYSISSAFYYLYKQIHISNDTQLPYILWHSDIDTQVSE